MKESLNIAIRRMIKHHQEKVSIVISIIMGLLFTTMIVSGLDASARERLVATQESLAEEVLRFHVLANSDSQEDQALKLEVKEVVIDYMEEDLENESSVLMTKMWVENHRENVLELCEGVIQEAGYDYPVSVDLNEAYFPVKTYGDITFPEGEYEALQIKIGDAKGQNWWCCLYPNLCFIDATYGVVSEDGKENLQEVLTVEEYELITSTTEYEIEWFFF